MKCLVTVILFFLWMVSFCSCRLLSEATGRRFNVLDYGADGSGKIDATPVHDPALFFLVGLMCSCAWEFCFTLNKFSWMLNSRLELEKSKVGSNLLDCSLELYVNVFDLLFFSLSFDYLFAEKTRHLSIENVLEIKAFQKAWGDFCQASEETPTLVVPAGNTFLLKSVTFSGPCMSKNPHVLVRFHRVFSCIQSFTNWVVEKIQHCFLWL